MTPRQRKKAAKKYWERQIKAGRRFSIVQQRLPSPVNLLLTIRIHLADGAGARWSNGMSGHEVQADANLLSAFALVIGGALGVALPMTIVIIWICS
jgi:hypothetical protein